MNLAEMLSYADIQDLGTIAQTYDCVCNGHSKNELIQSILTVVGRRDTLAKQIRELSQDDIRFLNSLLFDPRDSFGLEELAARVKQTKPQLDSQTQQETNPRDMIARFKRYGWLFNGYSQQTKYLFQVPNDLKGRFREELAKWFMDDVRACTLAPAAYREEHGLIVDDIFNFLKILFQQELTLSAEGYLYKRYLQQVLDSFAVHEEQVPRSAWRFGYGRRFKEYPSRFSLIYDYSFFNGLIEEEGQTLRLSEQGRARVLEGQKEDLMQVYRFWLRLYKGAVPTLQSIVHWIQRLAGSWVTAESLRGVLVPLIKPYYYDTSESIFEQRVLQMMMHLGMIRLGEAESLGPVVQITRLGSGVITGTYVPEGERIEIALTRA